MKRILSFLLLIAMMLSICACGEDNDTSNVEGSSSVAVSDDLSEDGTESASTDPDDVSNDDPSNDEVSKDETSKDETSKDETSKDETSKDETSKDEGNTAGDKNKEEYEQFQKVAKIDSTLKTRGFKSQGANSEYVPLNYDKMKAMWISQFDFNRVYCNSSSQRDKDSFRKYVEKAYDNLLSLGFNTVIVQVRPNGDSFYPSAYYPWSRYVVANYGVSGMYDPLEIMIEEAHERKISFQAWINPMRGMSSSNLSRINKAYPLASWKSNAKKKDYLYEYNGLLYLNIAYEEVRNNIINGAAELVRYYDVDGIHMDDYFYFGKEEAFDQKAFNEAKKTNLVLNLTKFRYNNLNALVSGIYSAIKAENKNVIFGISPAGNLNKMADTYYADVKTWLSKDGYVDYIMPQLYFGMEHSTWSFSATYDKWTAIVKNSKIKFMTGISFGKIDTSDQYAGAGKDEWINNDDVIKKCFQYAVKQSNFDGYAIFSYQSLFDPISGAPSSKSAKELANCKSYFTEIIKGAVIKY